jgi:hypothetical protein
MKKNVMSTEAKAIGSDGIQEAAERAAKGLDHEKARRSAAMVDQLREQSRRLFGSAEIGVSIIREFRGPLPE